MRKKFCLIFTLSLCLISFGAVNAEGQDEREKNFTIVLCANVNRLIEKLQTF